MPLSVGGAHPKRKFLRGEIWENIFRAQFKMAPNLQKLKWSEIIGTDSRGPEKQFDALVEFFPAFFEDFEHGGPM